MPKKTRASESPLTEIRPKQSPPAKAGSHGERYSLVDYALSGKLRLPKEHRKQRKFLKKLKRVGTDPQSKAMVRQFRDAVLRNSLSRKNQSAGVCVALTGPRGGEGTSMLSLLLAMSLGASRHFRVGYLDGRLNPRRFQVLSDMLALSKNSCQVEKGATTLDGYHNDNHPNLYFLRGTGDEESLDFFSDRRFKACLDELRQSFDFIVIDMPPVLHETSNIFIAPEVDDLYLVVAARKTRLVDIDRSVRMVGELEREFTGVIVNEQKLPFWSKLFWTDYFV